MRRHFIGIFVAGLIAMHGTVSVAQGGSSPMRWIADHPLHIDVLLVGDETEAVGFTEKFLADTAELALRRNRVPIRPSAKSGPPLAVLEISAYAIETEGKEGGYVWTLSKPPG